LWAYFGLTAIENLGIDIGVGFKFADSWYEEDNSSTPYKTSETSTTNNPLNVGVAVNFTSGSFGLKARVFGEFLGNLTYKYDTNVPGDKSREYVLGDGWGMTIDILPSFAINDKFTAFLSTGLAFHTLQDYIELNNKADPQDITIVQDKACLFEWHVNPYITLNYGAGTFFAGFRLYSPTAKYNTFDKYDGTNEYGDKTGNRILDWSIPIGIAISF